jgi:hypothetical protein
LGHSFLQLQERAESGPPLANFVGHGLSSKSFFNSIGQNQTFGDVGSMSALPKSGHGRFVTGCPLSANRRHLTPGFENEGRQLRRP